MVCLFNIERYCWRATYNCTARCSVVTVIDRIVINTYLPVVVGFCDQRRLIA